MTMSLAKYVDGKAEMKFGATWVRNQDKLIFVASVKDREIKKNNSYLHDFYTYQWTGGILGTDILNLFNSSYKTVYDDEDFQTMWESSQCFPREGYYNVYHPVTGKFLAANKFCYNAESGAKYKRGALASAYNRQIGEYGRGSFSTALRAILQKSHSYPWHTILGNETITGSVLVRTYIMGMTIVNSMYFPRYNFVDWRDPETLLSFFQQEQQLILSPTLKAVNVDGCIILFSNALPLGIYSERGFMLKETVASLYEKDLLQANLPFVVLKRLVRSQTFMIK